MPHSARDELRSKAALRIKAGLLPVIVPPELLAGYGAGETCALCGWPIEPKQPIYEVADGGHPPALALHVECYSAWQLECVARLSAKTTRALRRKRTG